MIYLDNNATTPLAEPVVEEMRRVAETFYGNPGSRHPAGRKARQLLEDSRDLIASLIGAAPSEVIFTSGGTEASNLAIQGLTTGRRGTIVLPPGEHPATEEPVKRLVQQGFRKRRLELNAYGVITDHSLSRVEWSEVVLATSILAHNETGTVQDLTPLVARCEEHRVPVHVDAVQAVGKIPVSFRDLGATTMSIGAHKFHGPRGIGALVIKTGTKVIPQILGGHQESGLRAGTEPVMLIAGMAKALLLCHDNLHERSLRLAALRDQLVQGLAKNCPPIVVNGHRECRLPNTANIGFPGCDADALLVALDLAGVCCSHGSACASGSSEPSPILLAMGCPPEVYQSSLRFSVGIQNTESDIEQAVREISLIVKRLRS